MTQTANATSVNHSLGTALSGALEIAVNTALKYDPATRQKVAAMTDILAIHIEQPALSLYFCGCSDGISVMHYCETPATTEVSGSLGALLNLIKNPAALAQSDVSVAGKIGVLQQWQDVFSDIDIDWEDALASKLGDASPYAASVIKKSFHYAKQQQKEIQRLSQEYFIEELRVVPSEAELEGFYQQVRDTSLAVDRIGARLTQLHNTLNQKG